MKNINNNLQSISEEILKDMQEEQRLKLKNSSKKETNKIIEQVVKKSFDKHQKLINTMKHDISEEQIINYIKKSLQEFKQKMNNKKPRIMNTTNQTQNNEVKFEFKKGDQVYFIDNDKLRTGKIEEDVLKGAKEAVVRPDYYDSEKKEFIQGKNLFSLETNNLSAPFKYKNITYESLSTSDKLNLLFGKETSVYPTENVYKSTSESGLEVLKKYKENVRFQIKKKGDKVVPKVIRPQKEKIYGITLSENQKNFLKEENTMLILDAKTKDEKEFEFIVQNDKELGGYVTKPFTSNYLSNKEGVLPEKAYIGGKTIQQSDIKSLLKGNVISFEVGKGENAKTFKIAFGKDLDKIIKKQEEKKDTKKKKGPKISR